MSFAIIYLLHQIPKNIAIGIKVFFINMNCFELSNKQLVHVYQADTVNNTAFNTYRAVCENWSVYISCIFPFDISVRKLIFISSRNGAKITIFFLIALFRKIDYKAAGFFYHVVGVSCRCNANHYHYRIKACISSEADY